ncbi:MAG: hypothetical protein KGJ86_08780, partial [Chloroflexota bacterium]|nr:hypothetical protein [Chloroflexota bacterium]
NTVGFDLYCKLLAESIQELKGEEVPDTTKKDTVTVDVGLDALISDDYVTDLAQKMNLYQRLALVTTLDQSAALLKEIRDRFGPLPEAVVNLFFLLDLKLRALEANVQVIKKSLGSRVQGPGSRGPGEVLLVLSEGATFDRAALHRRFGQSLRLGTQQLHLQASGDHWREQLPRLLDALGEAKHRARPSALEIAAASTRA